VRSNVSALKTTPGSERIDSAIRFLIVLLCMVNTLRLLHAGMWLRDTLQRCRYPNKCRCQKEKELALYRDAPEKPASFNLPPVDFKRCLSGCGHFHQLLMDARELSLAGSVRRKDTIRLIL
jgi:hypothetical protein